MLFRKTGISLIFLLIPISTANNIHCEGEPIKLSCLESSKGTEDKENTNALWKKSSGERVIWNYYGESETGDSFTNRRVRLNPDLSLSIDGCAQSDQGIYILFIDGEQSCRVRLFVEVSEECKTAKTASEQSTKSPTIPEESIHDATENLQTETILPRDPTRLAVCITPCLFVLVALLVFFVHTQREKSKNEKSESKLLNTENNFVKPCV